MSSLDPSASITSRERSSTTKSLNLHGLTGALPLPTPESSLPRSSFFSCKLDSSRAATNAVAVLHGVPVTSPSAGYFSTMTLVREALSFRSLALFFLSSSLRLAPVVGCVVLKSFQRSGVVLTSMKSARRRRCGPVGKLARSKVDKHHEIKPSGDRNQRSVSRILTCVRQGLHVGEVWVFLLLVIST